MRVKVDLAERSYDVVVEKGARHLLNTLIAQKVPDARLVLIVAPDSLQRETWFDFAPEIAWSVISVPDGEQAKKMSVVEHLCEEFLAQGLSRRDVVVSVGGGATCDVAGFASAVYQRGVAVIHVATTLVAQVDAAIGGKTGVNLSSAKNMMGSFHQPVGVLCDLETLETLADRERLCGLGEIAKCWLLESRSLGELERSDLSKMVEVAVSLKAAIVSADEREGGQRALLNYGHTLAHALEAEQMRGASFDLRHGEAVAIGLAFAARLALRLGRVDQSVVTDHDAVLDFFDLPRNLPKSAEVEALLDAMSRDKKAHHSLTFVLADGAKFSVVDSISPVDVRAALDSFKEEQ
jgi:5-deoxy-5-amino-3-dehydroquinate synthase